MEDLDWASGETLEDCLATVEALRPQDHLWDAGQGDQRAAEVGDAVGVSHDKEALRGAVMRLMKLLPPLFKGGAKKINQV